MVVICLSFSNRRQNDPICATKTGNYIINYLSNYLGKFLQPLLFSHIL